MNIVLSDICVYPVKALAGFSPPTAQVESLGLAGDRRWVVVDADGRFVSQRTHPRLATVQVRLTDSGLALTTAGMPALDVAQPSGHQRVPVSIWRDEVQGAGAGPRADQWFSALLGEPCRLAWMDDRCCRPLPATAGQPGGQVSFADGYPCLIISEASLADLNRRLADPIPMNRFRPNLVVSGCDAFAEDGWTRLAVGEAIFRATGPCARCAVTTIDQANGNSLAPEPLRTLATFRQVAKGVIFGVNLVVEQVGRIALGDPVQILS